MHLSLAKLPEVWTSTKDLPFGCLLLVVQKFGGRRLAHSVFVAPEGVGSLCR